MRKTVRVDREACISCGLCVSLAPEVFRFEDGKSNVHNPLGAPEKKIQDCIDGCPVGAIQWEEESSES